MRAGRIGAAFTAFAIAAAACLGGMSPAVAAAKPAVGKSGAKAAAGDSRVVATRVKAATSPIVGVGDAGAIAGEYIVVLQGVAGSQVAAEATALTTQYGGTVGDEYTDVLQGFSMAATSAQATAMAAAAAVSYVEQDEIDTASGLQVLPPATGSGPAPLWNLDRIDQRTNTPQNLYDYRNTASSVTAYVMDSGILITHTDFQGRAGYGFNAVAPGTAATDCNGHGTAVAGVLGGATYGVAKSVNLIAVKVLDCNGQGDGAEFLAGLDWIDKDAAQHPANPAVVNISITFPVTDAAIDTAVTNLSQSLTVVVSAGNSGVDASTVSPASAPGPIVVGATDSTDTQASFSNFGPRVDILAPGVAITSDYWTSNTAITTGSGTSLAAPAVAGAAAMILQDDPGSTPAQVKTMLIDNATSGTASSPVIQSLGTGSPDRLLYVPPPSVAVTVGGPSVSQAVGTGANAFDFTFAGTAGQTVYINGIGGSFDAAMTLYDPHGLNLGTGSHWSYDSGTPEVWIDPVNLPLTGTYTLHIIPDSGATGTVSAQVLTYATASATVGGAAVSATIPTSLPGQRISATFTGAAGQSVYINGTGGAFDTSMALYDPKGAQIATGSTNSFDSGTATTWISPTNLSLTGTYTLIITPDADATGTLSFQVIGSGITVFPTVGGAAVSATIPTTTPGQQVTATFAGTAGETLYINGTGGAFDTSMALYDPKGAQIATGSTYSVDSGTATTWISPTNLSLTGTYTLIITPDADATGTLSFQVIGSSITVFPTVGGAAVSATIPTTTPGQQVTATFAGTAGETLYINGTGGAFDTSMALYDPKGAQIATGSTYSVDSGTATTWISATNLDLTGTYTLIITPDADATGTLSFQVIASNVAVTATVGGSAVSATIPTSVPGQRVVASFAGAVGQTIYINGTSGAFNTSMILYDPKGAQIAAGYTYSEEPFVPTSWISPTNLDLTGTYTLIITPDADATGTLSFQVVGSYVTASTGVNGLPTAVTIPSSTPGQIMAITFSGNAGSAVSMLGITGAIGGTLTMYDPDGIQVATGIAIPLYPCPDDDAPGTCPQVLIAPVTIPLSGTYTVYFTPDAADTGSISVWVTSASGTAPTVTVIPASATVDGPIVPVTIATPSAANRIAVSFTGTAGQAVYINNSNSTIGCGNDSFSLVGPNGQLVVPAYSSTQDLCVLTTVLVPTGLPATGTYTLYIILDATQYGTANLQVLSQTPVTSATVDGAIFPLTIPSTSPGQIQAVSFTGTAGQAVYINNSSSTAGCDRDSYSLVGPNGQLVVPSILQGQDLCVPTTVLVPTGLPATGTYTLYIIPGGTQYGTANLQVLSQTPVTSATVDGAIFPLTIPSTSPGQIQAVSFTGTAGQAVYINNSSSTAGCDRDSYSLVGPNGQLVVPSILQGQDLCVPTTVLVPTGLPATGTYTLYIIPGGTQYGTANLQVLSQTPVTSATVDGAIFPLTIPSTSPGQIQAVSFTGTAGQAVYINNSSSTAGCDRDSYSMVGPNGQLVVPSSFVYLCSPAMILAPTGLPTSGTYTLYIVPDGTQYGTANLQILSNIPVTSAPVDGAITPVTIPSTSPGQIQAVSFTGTAGQAVYLDNDSNTLSGCNGDSYSLIGPSGQIIVPSYSPSADLCILTPPLPPTGLPATGTYTFYIVPDYSSQQGTANLQALSYGP